MKLRHFYLRLLHRLQAQPQFFQADALLAIAITSVATTGLVLAIQFMGKLEHFELFVYDRMMQMRGSIPADSRLLIVGIDENDILERNVVTPPDKDIAQALEILQNSDPRLIGLDLHRNTPNPPGAEELARQMEAENLIVIKKLGPSPSTRIAPPKGVPAERVGFNNLPIDQDGVVRRNLIIATDEEGSYFSFSLQLAVEYLSDQNITPQSSAAHPDYLQLGDAVFEPLQPGDGGYQQADTGGYQILLNYRGEDPVAEQVSLSDVLNQRVDPAQIKGRIVLIGSTAESLKDLFFTPYSTGETTGHKMPGVEIHAQMLSQVLDAAEGNRPLFWFWPQWAEAVWIWIWAIAGGMMGWAVRRPAILGIGCLTLLASLTSITYIVFLMHGWIPLIAPSLSLALSLGFVVAYQSQQAQIQSQQAKLLSQQAKEQQQMVMKLLGQSTSPQIAEALWQERDRLLKSGKLPGQRLIATMLFADIRGFSTLAEKLPPEAVLNWLNEYLNEMVEAVTDYHGIVNKFTGDGLMAVFGVPVPRIGETEIAEDATNAVDCALSMANRLQALNQDWSDRGFATAKMRIGIFTGPVVAGSLGGRERLEYGVIGDSVNTAARLEGCVKIRQTGICRILIARETLIYLDDQFQIEPWGELALKGKEQLAEVYRVVARKTSIESDDAPEVDSDVSPSQESPAADPSQQPLQTRIISQPIEQSTPNIP